MINNCNNCVYLSGSFCECRCVWKGTWAEREEKICGRFEQKEAGRLAAAGQ